ncbi:MAG: hypothetical protein QOF61_1113 [Acidobacteriota bacterium]|nr:hypothetical protein [Acidobacteriota bacterium]
MSSRSGCSRVVLRALAFVVIVLVALGGWIAFDLTRTRATDLRRFDPDEVARLETAMWRSYYSRDRLKLYTQLGELLRRQYGFTYWKSQAVAYHAARAAFVFKDGRTRTDYERALPDLLQFYAALREASHSDFDVERAAQLELEWWIVHRERARHAPGDLDRALAALASEIYRVPADRLEEHARLRAEAMRIRDDKAAAGGVTEADWARIDALLHASWQSLHRAVNS